MSARLHTPIPIITHDGGLIIAAAKNHPEIATRLGAPAIAAADALCTKLAGDVSTQKSAKGELGTLTQGQLKNLKTLHQSLAQAQKTAKLAFKGQTVKLHQEFAIGSDGHALAGFLSRCDTVLASVQIAANQPAFKLKGWSDAETGIFQTARTGFGPAEQYRVQSTGSAKDATTQQNADAVALYDAILTIQNAADLQWTAGDPANAGVRGQFLLGIFPPDHGGNSAPAPAPQEKEKAPAK